MKTKLFIFAVLCAVIFLSGCKTSKDGCAGAKYQGPTFKSTKFDWYKN